MRHRKCLAASGHTKKRLISVVFFEPQNKLLYSFWLISRWFWPFNGVKHSEGMGGLASVWGGRTSHIILY